jgi:NAD(P)H-hydrate epimerase
MKIFSAAQIRAWDQYTISNEPITSINLVERAAKACYRWIKENIEPGKNFIFFCGNGNNGSDGLAIARMLLADEQSVKVFILSADKRSADCEINLERLKALNIAVNEITDENNFPEIQESDLVIDALFGTGLNKPILGITEQLVRYINQSSASIISIDMPSGLFADTSSQGNSIINATDTLSFQCNKLAFMLAENAAFTGNIHLLNIRLHHDYYQNTESVFASIDQQLIHKIYKPRKQFTHKYSFGHALLYAGSKNMMGAAILSAKACLRSGAGLVTVHTEEKSIPVIQTALPEAIASNEDDFNLLSKKKAAIGIGPGLEQNDSNSTLLLKLINTWDNPLVIDASALGLLQPLAFRLSQRKKNPAILTPHTGEFENIFGKAPNDFERMQTAIRKAVQLNCYIILKGKNSLVACPDGKGYFNTTGNSGMATAGSGDVLTGILTGLLCQGYTAEQACLLGVYLHGLAGDIAAEKFSPEAMIAGDITEQLGAAYKMIR